VEARAGQFYDFRSKYAQGGSIHRTPAPLPQELTARVQELATLAHGALGARDLSRTDMILSESGQPTLLETNTLPGMTGVSLFPEAAQAAGISFSELVDRLVRRALERVSGGPTRASGVALPAPFA
jgi:D-alanine-D-alanine ligase